MSAAPSRPAAAGGAVLAEAGDDVRVVFSDLDGTLVHYERHFGGYARVVGENGARERARVRYEETGEERECAVLGSLTGGRAYLSAETVRLVAALRALGVRFVLISGARASTYLGRRAALPACDFEFWESGGRMMRDGRLVPEWSAGLGKVVGEADWARGVPQLPQMARRRGALWEMYRRMESDGWKLDARSYATSFRVDVAASPGKSVADFDHLVRQELPPARLASSFNLGKADIYPSASGKANAARHVLKLTNIDPRHAIAMFDDNNDLELGALCGRAFLPAVTHPSVRDAIKVNPAWKVTDSPGILGTEEALKKIIAIREQHMLSAKHRN